MNAPHHADQFALQHVPKARLERLAGLRRMNWPLERWLIVVLLTGGWARLIYLIST